MEIKISYSSISNKCGIIQILENNKVLLKEEVVLPRNFVLDLKDLSMEKKSFDDLSLKSGSSNILFKEEFGNSYFEFGKLKLISSNRMEKNGEIYGYSDVINVSKKVMSYLQLKDTIDIKFEKKFFAFIFGKESNDFSTLFESELLKQRSFKDNNSTKKKENKVDQTVNNTSKPKEIKNTINASYNNMNKQRDIENERRRLEDERRRLDDERQRVEYERRRLEEEREERNREDRSIISNGIEAVILSSIYKNHDHNDVKQGKGYKDIENTEVPNNIESIDSKLNIRLDQFTNNLGIDSNDKGITEKLISQR